MPVLPSGSFLFLSDVHLGAWSDEKNRELEDQIIMLIDFCKKNRLKMVILGDFFDYWMEYPGKRVPPLGKKMLEHFREYHLESHSHTLFVTGNHDNWTFGYFKDIGFDVEHEYRIIHDDDMAIMVLHGDGLSNPEMDIPRPVMHRILRNPYFVRMYQTLLPPRIGWAGMQLFAGFSRKTGKKKSEVTRRSMLDSWARNQVRSNDRIHAVVYGHHHRAGLWHENGLTCMNCGSFGSDKTLGLYANRAFEIVTWDEDEKTLESIVRLPKQE
ncbi:MAG: metallophosphoesterase [Cyclonatronaceae bacterium]